MLFCTVIFEENTADQNVLAELKPENMTSSPQFTVVESIRIGKGQSLIQGKTLPSWEVMATQDTTSTVVMAWDPSQWS